MNKLFCAAAAVLVAGAATLTVANISPIQVVHDNSIDDNSFATAQRDLAAGRFLEAEYELKYINNPSRIEGLPAMRDAVDNAAFVAAQKLLAAGDYYTAERALRVIQNPSHIEGFSTGTGSSIQCR